MRGRFGFGFAWVGIHCGREQKDRVGESSFNWHRGVYISINIFCLCMRLSIRAGGMCYYVCGTARGWGRSRLGAETLYVVFCGRLVGGRERECRVYHNVGFWLNKKTPFYFTRRNFCGLESHFLWGHSDGRRERDAKILFPASLSLSWFWFWHSREYY